ncbi:cytidylyltransferase domain-containing protein [Magnetococcales bacterium HHB-1]
MTVSLILQARMGSTRFPGKSMMDLAGEPLVGRILERVKRCQRVDHIVLAIPDTPQNDSLDTLAKRYDVPSFRGSEDDLVDRYYRAALAFNTTVVIRLPADNTTPEPREIDRIIEFHQQNDFHFSTNLSPIQNSGYPDGIGAEAFDFKTLEEVHRTNFDPDQREHVSNNFLDYASHKAVDPQRFTIGTPICPKAFQRPDLILDVNTINEYRFMQVLYSYLYPQNPQFHISDTLRWYDEVYLKLGGTPRNHPAFAKRSTDGITIPERAGHSGFNA